MFRLKLVPDETRFPFMKYKWPAIAASLVLMLGSLALTFAEGLNLGIDFTGGIMIEVGSEQAVPIGEVRATMNGLGLGAVGVQEFGATNDFLIRLQTEIGDAEAQAAAVARVQDALAARFDNLTWRRVEIVGPKVSGELIRDGALAVLFAIGAILVYIWFRFEWHFGAGAVAALIHDVVLTIGLFALTRMEFNLSTIAALLTIVGYSLNDTVVVFDRIRENLRKFRKMDIEELMDLSINQTLSRTLMTSGTTLLALFALYFFGGEVIRGFTAAMIWGIFVGTYSSIFIASPLLKFLRLRQSDVSLETPDGDRPVPQG
jgi:preprotein translocase subunit SecF